MNSIYSLPIALAAFAPVVLPACSSDFVACEMSACSGAIAGAGGASGTRSTPETSNTSGGVSGKGGGSSSGAGDGGDGGADSSAGSDGVAPPTCDGTLSPDVDACVISDEYGVFVSPTGIDATAEGTQAHPYATVTAALAGIAKIKHVYVCVGDGDYMEPDTLQIPDRVSIYGGFTCAGGTWKYDSASSAHLISARPIGAMITNAKVGVVLQDLRLDAANASEDGTGANSFGLMISGSQGVALKRVEIRAGNGGKGKSGADGATISDAIPSGDAQKGKDAQCGTPTVQVDGGTAVGVQCTSQGGKGGDGIKGNMSQTTADRDGKTGFPGVPNGITASQTLNQGGVDGKAGKPGSPGVLGASASAIGTFSANGYVGASGGDGRSGQPGQGGGGGASSFARAACVGASGGAGGMGGCGGSPGVGGRGGGVSVALLSWESSVTIETCSFAARDGGAAGNGGNGGAAGQGQDGGKGGVGDPANQVGIGGQGGTGGNGGNGGSGAGGTGGPSIAIVWNGTKPAWINEPSLHFADKPAAAGVGGQLGLDVANKAPDGSVGMTQGIYPKL